MSADEIRRLAELPSVQFGGRYSPDEKSMIRSALLSYAAMVERCEEVSKLSFFLEDGHTNIDHIIKPQIDYILKGATDDSKI